jgi:hypothetical protein
MTREEATEMIERHAAQIGEHCEAVQIMVSRPVDGGGTEFIKRGVGNWYARIGMAREFLNSDQAQDQAFAIAAQLRENE